jgi:1-phosphatidylinositol-3-phosphate 5-kinase
LSELKKVKHILRFLVFASYHLRLEMSFLMDEFAIPPASPDAAMFILSDNEETSSDEANTMMKSTDLGTKWIPLVSAKSVQDKTSALVGTPMSPEDDLSIFTKPKPEPELLPQIKLPEPENNITLPSEPLSIDIPDGMSASKPASKSPKISSAEILDQSDPLHSYQLSKDDTIFLREGELKEEKPRLGNKFKKALEDVLLSISPLVKYSVPYLETNEGSQCFMRSYFPQNLYQSELFSDGPQRKTLDLVQPVEKILANQTFAKVEKRECHEFTNKKITTCASDNEVQVKQNTLILIDYTLSCADSLG